MRVAVVGIGAIGGWFAFKMAQAGFEVSALARGATLGALREHGIRLGRGDEVSSSPIKASDDASALGKQDMVVLTVKGPALAEAAQAASDLLRPDTIVLPAMNGVPWWFFDGLPGPFSGDGSPQSIPRGGSLPPCPPATLSAASFMRPARRRSLE
jgi:2-dehydropantoate 2-reductase